MGFQVVLDFSATIVPEKPGRVLTFDLSLYQRFLGNGEISPAISKK
jgi:hypothetical protein